MNNKLNILFVMNRYALFAIMVVISYGLCAQTPDKSNLLDSSSTNWVFSVEFKESALHSYGFDDYTNWNPQYAYYLSPRIGKCDLPYISVKSGQTGRVMLDMFPSTIVPGLNISSDDNISRFPSTIACSQEFSFNTSTPPEQYSSEMSASMVGTSLAKMIIKCYHEKDITVRLVRVNRANGTPDFSCIEKQAIVKVNTTDNDSYPLICIPNIPNNIFLNDNTEWTIDMLLRLKDYFFVNQSNPPNTYTMFIIKGSKIIKNNEIAYGASIRGGLFSWVLENRISSRTSPHELGHCLKLYDNNNDKDALMCQSSVASGVNAMKLRMPEWVKIHE